MSALLLACMAGTARGQSADTGARGHQLVSRTIAAPYTDTIVLDLRKHGDYRIVLSPGNVSVHVAPVRRNAAGPFVPEVTTGDATHESRWELYPGSDGSHAITLTATSSSGPIRLEVWEDSAVEKSARQKADRRWHLGFSATGGYATKYGLHDSVCDCVITRNTGASTFLEGGVVVASQSRFGLELGYGDEWLHNGLATIGWSFAEPRYRLAAWHPAGHRLDIDFLVRVAKGAANQGYQNDPTWVGAGLLFNAYLGTSGRPRGIMLGGYVMAGKLGNVSATFQAAYRAGAQLTGLF
jgi:hypothetical protein